MVCIFSLYYKTITKRTEGDKKRAKERERRTWAASPSYYMWSCVCLYPCVYTEPIHVQTETTGSVGQNKFLWGLWTPSSFLRGSHGRDGVVSALQLMLNKREPLVLKVALVWRANVQIFLKWKSNSEHLCIHTSEWQWCRACETHESEGEQSAFV